MKLTFIFSIRLGFLLASSRASHSLLRQLKNYQLHWNRESSMEFIIAYRDKAVRSTLGG